MKRAIFVRSKTIVMTELDKKIREKEIYRVTLVGSFVNFLLVIFKFLAGIAGHSAAMLADAVHSLSDFITDVVVILFVVYPINQWTRAIIMVMGNMNIGYCFHWYGIIGGRIWNIVEWSNRYIGFPTRWGTSSTGNVGIGCCHYFYSVEGNTLSIYSQSGEKMPLTGCCGECVAS
mgnify:CR=1 FL=1